MSNKVLLKKSSVSSKVPLTTDLSYGEPALNYADGKIFYLTSSNTIDKFSSDTSTATLTNKTLSSATLTGSLTAGGSTGTSGQVLQSTGTGVQWASASGTGTVTSITAGTGLTGGTITTSGTIAVDSTIARRADTTYIGTTAVALNRASAALALTGIDSIDFTGTAATLAAGRIWYDSTTGSWNAGMGGGNISQQIGEEIFVYGKASSALTGNSILQAVYQTGTVGSSGVITFAPTTSGITNADSIIGIATEDIAINGFGRVTYYGIVHGIDTTGSTYSETWADGDIIWYNPVTGGLTKTKPTAPNLKVRVGTIIKAGTGGSGSFRVELDKGSTLGGTDANVEITSVADTQLLQYYGTGGYWKNVSPSTITGVGSANALNTSNNYQVNSLGVGTAPSGTTGQIVATGTITSAYSDARLKTFEGKITNALSKVMAINGYYFKENETAKKLGYDNDNMQVGVSAQEIEAVLPEVVVEAPINKMFEGADYKTVHYEKLVPLLIEAIKEQQAQIEELKIKLGNQNGD